MEQNLGGFSLLEFGNINQPRFCVNSPMISCNFDCKLMQNSANIIRLEIINTI